MISATIGRSVFGVLCLAAALTAVPKTAAAQSVQTTTPFSSQVLNTCTNELVDISGQQTITMNSHVDSAGGLHTSFALITKGTGVGEVTGTTYPYSENDLFNLQIGSAATATVRVKTRLKGPGSIDNWDMTFMLHITLNADGTVTSLIDTFTTTCRG